MDQYEKIVIPGTGDKEDALYYGHGGALFFAVSCVFRVCVSQLLSFLQAWTTAPAPLGSAGSTISTSSGSA